VFEADFFSRNLTIWTYKVADWRRVRRRICSDTDCEELMMAVLLIVGSVVFLCLVVLILGLVILGAGEDQGRNTFSARQDWMNSHVEENE
jgi:hypothetical protein